MKHDILSAEAQVVYESFIPLIIKEAEKVQKSRAHDPAKGAFDLIQDGCAAVLEMMQAGRDLRLARMEISRAMRKPQQLASRRRISQSRASGTRQP